MQNFIVKDERTEKVKNHTALVMSLLVIQSVLALVRVGISLPLKYIIDCVQAGQQTDWENSLVSLADWEAFVSNIQIAIWWILGISVLSWLYKAHRNTRYLGARGLRFSDAACIWWYFIPLACFIVPYQTLKETWQASINPLNWRFQKSPMLLSIWWGLWLFSSFLGYLIFNQQHHNGGLDRLSMLLVLVIVSNISTVLLNVVFFRIIKRIDQMQKLSTSSDTGHF